MAHSEGMSHQVRPARSDDHEACLQIVRASPDYFTEDVPVNVQGDLERHDGWVIVESGEMVGFVVVGRRSPQAAELTSVDIDPDGQICMKPLRS
jgi:hypothetical protein